MFYGNILTCRVTEASGRLAGMERACSRWDGYARRTANPAVLVDKLALTESAMTPAFPAPCHVKRVRYAI